MNYIHLALFIGIAICLLIISWKSNKTEGFNDVGEGLIFTSSQCPLISNQIKGYKEAIATAQAENHFSTVRNYRVLVESLEEQAKAIGCTGEEAAAAVPLALPSTMSSTEVEDAKPTATVIDLTQVPSIASVS
jgi:hypothetical protein